MINTISTVTNSLFQARCQFMCSIPIERLIFGDNIVGQNFPADQYTYKVNLESKEPREVYTARSKRKVA